MQDIPPFCTVNESYPGPSRCSPSLRLAIEYVADLADKEHRLKNGKTALFWGILNHVEKCIASDSRNAETIRKLKERVTELEVQLKEKTSVEEQK